MVIIMSIPSALISFDVDTAADTVKPSSLQSRHSQGLTPLISLSRPAVCGHSDSHLKGGELSLQNLNCKCLC